MKNTSKKRRVNIMDLVMAEHVEMPGFPQIIVTRDWLYQWLKGCGWNPCDRGYSSLDYIVFGRKSVDLSLYTDERRDFYLNAIRDQYTREEVAA